MDKKLYIFEDEQSLDSCHILLLSDEQLAIFYWFIELGYDFCIKCVENGAEDIDVNYLLTKYAKMENYS